MSKQVSVACVGCAALFTLEGFLSVVNVHMLLEFGLVHESPDGDADGALEGLVSLGGVHVPDVALVVGLAEDLAAVLARDVGVDIVNVPEKRIQIAPVLNPTPPFVTICLHGSSHRKSLKRH